MTEDGEEGKEVSGQKVEEVTVAQEVFAGLSKAFGVSTTPSAPMFDLNIASPSGNASLASTDSCWM